MPLVFSAMKAIIKNRSKFLVLKERVKGAEFWTLPGGKVHFNESPLDALHREVKEEIGLEIKIIKPVGVFWFFRLLDKYQVVCTTYLCTCKGNPITLTQNPANECIIEYRWVTKKNF
ncbi:MAG: NUDIX hydrolase [Candidatus Aenigmarchaeota archaeon]|nr:NUDIX hydrolase [Candidatus Aenigmarchaeota archaeon]